MGTAKTGSGQSIEEQFYNKAVQADENGKSREALTLSLKAADLGHHHAMNFIGTLHCGRTGIRKDLIKALYWFRRAWRTGSDPYVLSNIASTYADLGNRRQARFWWRRSVASKDGDSALEFAKFSMDDKRSNRREVIKLLRVAANSKFITPDGLEQARALLTEHENKQ